MQPEVVAPVDEGGSALELLDKEAEEMRLVGIVQTLDATFRYDAAVVCLRRLVRTWLRGRVASSSICVCCEFRDIVWFEGGAHIQP
jgi:hypothetical protein